MEDNNKIKNPKFTIEGYGHFNQGTSPDINDTNRPKPPKRSDKKELNFLLQKKNESSDQEVTPTNPENNESKPRKVDAFGDPITINLANLLVQDFYHEFENKAYKAIKDKFQLKNGEAISEQSIYDLIDLIAQFIPYKVTFSKEVLMMLLSQPNCAGIKSYFCMGLPEEKVNKENSDNPESADERKPSLVLVGVDINDCDLKSNRDHPRKPSIIYINNLEDQIEYDIENSKSDDKIIAKAQETLAYEVGGTDNVQTLSEKFGPYKKTEK